MWILLVINDRKKKMILNQLIMDNNVGCFYDIVEFFFMVMHVIDV